VSLRIDHRVAMGRFVKMGAIVYPACVLEASSDER
jgi:hypothetical protein